VAAVKLIREIHRIMEQFGLEGPVKVIPQRIHPSNNLMANKKMEITANTYFAFVRAYFSAIWLTRCFSDTVCNSGSGVSVQD